VNVELKDATGCRVVSLLTGQAIGETPSVQLQLTAHAVEALRVEPKQDRIFSARCRGRGAARARFIEDLGMG
jgi:hypothetical protein